MYELFCWIASLGRRTIETRFLVCRVERLGASKIDEGGTPLECPTLHYRLTA